MHVSITEMERETYKKSPVHGIDGRIKILMTLAITIYVVSLPRMETLNFTKLGYTGSISPSPHAFFKD